MRWVRVSLHSGMGSVRFTFPLLGAAVLAAVIVPALLDGGSATEAAARGAVVVSEAALHDMSPPLAPAPAADGQDEHRRSPGGGDNVIALWQ
jgi:hypothetical protein